MENQSLFHAVSLFSVSVCLCVSVPPSCSWVPSVPTHRGVYRRHRHSDRGQSSGSRLECQRRQRGVQPLVSRPSGESTAAAWPVRAETHSCSHPIVCECVCVSVNVASSMLSCESGGCSKADFKVNSSPTVTPPLTLTQTYPTCTYSCKLSSILDNAKHCKQAAEGLHDGTVARRQACRLHRLMECLQNHIVTVSLSGWRQYSLLNSLATSLRSIAAAYCGCYRPVNGGQIPSFRLAIAPPQGLLVVGCCHGNHPGKLFYKKY